MFDFFHAVTAKVGAIFLSVALFLGAGTPTTTMEPVVENNDIAPRIETTEQAKTIPAPTVTQKSNSSAPAPVTKSQSVSTSANAVLAIEDVSAAVDGLTVTFSWKTTVDARSSIILNGETFDSVEGVSKSHHTVSIKGLKKGTRYAYDVVAKTLGSSAAEDKITRAFSTQPTYVITLGLSDDKKCYKLTVADNEEYLVPGYVMRIEAKNPNITVPAKSYTTNGSGEVEYCSALSQMTIEAKDIEKVVGSSDVLVSGYSAENLTTKRVDEYGTFFVKFQVTKLI